MVEKVDKAPCLCGGEGVFLDRVTLRCYCLECSASPKTSTENVYFQFLDMLIPFDKGDKVSCRQAKNDGTWESDGEGTITDISKSIEDGATEKFPVYTVKLRSGRIKKYTAICLTRLH